MGKIYTGKIRKNKIGEKNQKEQNWKKIRKNKIGGKNLYKKFRENKI